MIRPPLLCCCLPMIIYLSIFLSLSFILVCLSFLSILLKSVCPQLLAVRCYVNSVKSFFRIHCPTIYRLTLEIHTRTHAYIPYMYYKYSTISHLIEIFGQLRPYA